MMKSSLILSLCLFAIAPSAQAETSKKAAATDEQEAKAPDDAPINNKAAPFTSKNENDFDYRPYNEGQQTFVGFFSGPGLKGLVERPDAAELQLNELTFHTIAAKELMEGKKLAEGNALCSKVSKIFYDVAPGENGKNYKTEILPGSKKDFCEIRATELDPKSPLAETHLLVRTGGASDVWAFRSRVTRRMKENPEFAKGLADQAAFVQALKPRR